MEFFLVTLLTVSATFLWFVWSRWSKSLPSPFFQLPFIGYWPFLSDFPYVTFTSMAKRLGDVFSIQIGTQQIVVLNSESAIQHCYNRKEFAGRPEMACWTLFKDSGFRSRFPFRSMYSDPECKYLRKTAVASLAHISGRSEELVVPITDQCVAEMIANLSGEKDFASLSMAVYKCITTVMGSLCFGPSYNPSDPLLKDIFQRFEGLSKLLRIGSPLDYLPFGHIFARKILPKYREKVVEPLNKLIDKMLANHIFNPNLPSITDFLMSTTCKAPLESTGVRQATVHTIGHDLFAGGYQTTAESFVWAILLISSHQKVQDKLRESLKTNDDNNNDNKQNSYLQAVVLEVLRFSSLVPLSLPHRTIEDVKYKGKAIPKDTLVLSNLWKLHHDTDEFVDPYEFQPDRFIGDNSDQINSQLAAKIFPFGVGQRRCPGEKLAKDLLMAMLAQLVTHRKLEIQSDPNVFRSCRPGIVRSLLPFDVLFTDISQ